LAVISGQTHGITTVRKNVILAIISSLACSEFVFIALITLVLVGTAAAASLFFLTGRGECIIGGEEGNNRGHFF
jgi:hypothetical protein